MTEIKKYQQEHICHRPWTSLDVNPMGEFRPCCIYNEPVKDDHGNNLSVHNSTINDVINSNYMNNLRQEFLSGGKPKQCEACWKEEAAGKKSQRMHIWEKPNFNLLGKYNIEKNINTLYDLTMRLGNICNLKCRICNEISSSQWSNEKIKENKNNIAAIERLKNINRLGQWPRQSVKYFEDLDSVLENIRFFEFTGGEPLLIEEQFAILQKCIDAGSAPKIEVHYNTNGTVYPENAIKSIWPKFKRIELAFSIDDVGTRFEYQRHPAVWNNVEENIYKIKNAGMTNLSIQICTTINVMNILYLDEIEQFVNELNPDFWHINILHEPAEFDVQRIPQKIKEKINNKFKKHIKSKEITVALDYMSNKDYNITDWKEKLMYKLTGVDENRGEKFEKTFPELYSLIQ
jgi:MoaA/NifB/PqqE/SkfB family radical SAM enzyme